MRRNCVVVAWLLLAGLPASAQGTITTIAGNYPPAGLAATAACVGRSFGLAADGLGNVYASSLDVNQVYRIDNGGQLFLVAGSNVTGFSGDGGQAAAAALNGPKGIAADAAGNFYIADESNHRIRKVSASGGITTVAGTGIAGFNGDGLATSARLNFPSSVAVDSAGNLYVADVLNHRIRKVGSSGVISTVAGTGVAGPFGDGGPATSAQLRNPSGVAVDSAGNLYIADTNNDRVRKVDASSGMITTVGVASRPVGVAVDGAANLFIADTNSHCIRRVEPSGMTTTVAGTCSVAGYSGDGGPATGARLTNPSMVALDVAGHLYIADANNRRIRKVTASTGVISTLAGNGASRGFGDGGPALTALLVGPAGMALDGTGRLHLANGGVVCRVELSGLIACPPGGGGATGGVAVDASGDLYIAAPSFHCIRKVDAFGAVTTVAGTCFLLGFSGDGGPATSALLRGPFGVALDTAGNLYIADSANHRIRKVDGSSGVIATIAGTGVAGFSGDGGLATAAQLRTPIDVFVDSIGRVYVADTSNNRVRRVDTTGVITTVAGTGVFGFNGDGIAATSAHLRAPRGITVDAAGDLYIADTESNRIRTVGPSGLITTVAGSGVRGFSGDNGASTIARLAGPSDVVVGSAGRLYISDTFNHRIRQVTSLNTAAGNGVVVQPTDSATGGSPVTLTFDNVTQAGETELVTSASGPPPPTGFRLGSPPTYYELTTTAVFSGSIEICVSYAGVVFGNESQLGLFHFEGGNWVNVTTSLDTTADRICGVSTSLSPFAVFERANRPPVADAGPDGIVECSGATTPVVLDGSTSSDPDGDPLAFSWTDAAESVLGGTAVVMPSLLLGTHDFTLTVSDGQGESDADTVNITVRDTTAPALDLPEPLLVTCRSAAPPGGAGVPGDDAQVAAWLGSATANDACDPAVPVTHDAPAVFGIGTTAVRFSASDDSDNTVQESRDLRVVYEFGGFLAPLLQDNSASIKQGKQGRTIPVKFPLSCAGVPAGTAVATIAVFKLIDADTGSVDTTNLTQDAGSSSDNGSLFRYDPVDQHYIFNLSTRGFPAPATYRVFVSLEDGTTRFVDFSLRP